MIASGNDADGLPIPWVALSGLAADLTDPHVVYAVSDAFLAEGFIYTIDTSRRPRIIDRVRVTDDIQDDDGQPMLDFHLDLEGIAVGPDGSFWVAVEGNADDTPNAILEVDPTGEVTRKIFLPAELEENARSNGFEGIAVTGSPGAEVIHVAFQRAWPDAGDLDRVNTKIGRYTIADGPTTRSSRPSTSRCWPTWRRTCRD